MRDSGTIRPVRWYMVFGVIAVLSLVFALIAFWGLAQSDWLYGTYDGISEAHWDRIAGVRDHLAQLGTAPAAVDALNQALLEPRPATEEVLFHLQQAALALEAVEDLPVRRMQGELYGLISEIKPGYTNTPTPRATPTRPPARTPGPWDDAPIV